MNQENCYAIAKKKTKNILWFWSKTTLTISTDAKNIQTFLLLANCSNWCRNDVICGWNCVVGLYCVLFVWRWCWDCDTIEAPGNVDIIGRFCDWLGTGTVKFCGEAEQLSGVSLQ